MQAMLEWVVVTSTHKVELDVFVVCGLRSRCSLDISRCSLVAVTVSGCDAEVSGCDA